MSRASKAREGVQDRAWGCPAGRTAFVWAAIAAAGIAGLPAAMAGAGEAATVTSVSVVDRPAVTSDIVSIDIENTPIRQVVDYLVSQTGHNILVDKDVDLTVTQRLLDVNWRQALEIVLRGTGCYLEEESANIYRISKPETISGMGEDDIRKVLKLIAGPAGVNLVISPEVKGPVDYNFKDVTWKAALDSVVKAAGYVAVREGTVIRVVSPDTLKAQLETRVFQMKYIRPPSTYTATTVTPYAVGAPKATTIDEKTGTPTNFTLYHALKKALSDHGRMEYDDGSNSFLVTDTAPVLDQIQKIIERLDVEPLQVFVDVRFVTTTGTDAKRFGVDWTNGATATLTPGTMVTRFPFSRPEDNHEIIEGLFGLTGEGYTDANLAAFLGGASPFAFGTLSFSRMTAVLELLKNDEDTRIRQSPRLMILNHQPGTVFVGNEIRFAEIVSASSQGGGVETGVREADNSPINTGFQLLVVPHVVRGTGDILMTVIPQSNSLTEFKEFGAAPNLIELPQIASSTVVTQMLVRDGKTAVIGGLVVDREEKQIRKVPVLGNIPLAGWLFKWKKTNKIQEHLMIFITPRVVRTAEDARKILVSHQKYDWPEPPRDADAIKKADADTTSAGENK